MVGRVAAVLYTAVATLPAPSHTLTLTGVGPVQFGVSIAAASQAAGEVLVRTRDKAGYDECYFARRPSLPALLFMVEDGRIARAETADPGFRTYSGVHVGDSEAKVRTVYGRVLETQPHKYSDDGHYLVVRSRDRRSAIVMETDGTNVTDIRAGLMPAVEYVEGCI